MDNLPAVLLLQVLRFLDHSALHAAEQTSHALLNLTCEHTLWRDLVTECVICSETLVHAREWKKVSCLAQRRPIDDKHMLRGIEGFSSADRPSESPVNTLTPSRCWMEVKELQGAKIIQETDLTTLGERIQHRCGCSSGESCYWSSSASTNQNATEFIDYALNEPCIVNAVQIVPYRVFWHPESPTYAPKKVRFEFFDVQDMTMLQQGVRRWQNQFVEKVAITPFYATHDYEVQNDMTLQQFVLPRKVVASKDTILRIMLIGRHQAQTFELPPDLFDREENQQPKYYCCLSYVNICGVPLNLGESDSSSAVAQSYKIRSNLRMAALTGLVVYMTAYYEGFIGRTRRWV
ncbi:hypothetical protein PsorP6_013968 [Peronosclerospora sorghi]|uniref:Uncharacterized protein n=1 Tax=Peronosclerospora sorghi TaxID=230839 RepID=A0ACC0VID3_9STRA|nr:hypothetical protein PsorP6_013968 [Peronosclerospora sorghi]